MPCAEWKESWVAHLYGELDAAEERALGAHLGRCPACTATIEGLRRAQVLLHEAPPAIPAAPRVIVLGSSPAWYASWGFAAGSLAAGLVLAAGLWAVRHRTETPVPHETIAANPAPTSPGRSDADLAQQVAALEARLGRIETTPAVPSLTPAQLHDELARFERRLDRERANELDYLLQSITASELRTGTWIDQTRDAIHLLAARQDPQVREQ